MTDREILDEVMKAWNRYYEEDSNAIFSEFEDALDNLSACERAIIADSRTDLAWHFGELPGFDGRMLHDLVLEKGTSRDMDFFYSRFRNEDTVFDPKIREVVWLDDKLWQEAIEERKRLEQSLTTQSNED